MTRDSRIGEITNAATSIENKYLIMKKSKNYTQTILHFLESFREKKLIF